MTWYGFFRMKTTLNTDESVMQTLSEPPDLRGSVMHDVNTTVLMREHDVNRVCTRGTGFRRFPFLTVLDPLGDW